MPLNIFLLSLDYKVWPFMLTLKALRKIVADRIKVQSVSFGKMPAFLIGRSVPSWVIPHRQEEELG